MPLNTIIVRRVLFLFVVILLCCAYFRITKVTVDVVTHTKLMKDHGFVVKLNEIFARDDLTQQTMCKVLGGISNPTLTKFLSIKCIQIVGNKMYKLASYVFLRS